MIEVQTCSFQFTDATLAGSLVLVVSVASSLFLPDTARNVIGCQAKSTALRRLRHSLVVILQQLSEVRLGFNAPP
jgi:hypothetical protein